MQTNFAKKRVQIFDTCQFQVICKFMTRTGTLYPIHIKNIFHEVNIMDSKVYNL